MRIRFRLREKLILITVGIILLAVGITVYLNLKDFIRVYKESIIKRVFAQSRELEVLIADVTELGLGLGELKGLNRECQKLVEAIPYARYSFVMDNEGKVYYHNFSGKVGSVYTDSITQKALQAGEKLVQHSRLDSGERIYDFSVPIGEIAGEQIGLIRIGILSEIIDKEISRLRNRALSLGVFFILIAATLVFFLTKFSILKPLKYLMDGIATFGKGRLDSRIALKTGDEIEELANSFNQMAENLEKTTVSRDALVQEVSERKKVEEALRASERKFRELAELLPEIVFESDKEGNITFVNRMAFSTFGYTQKDFNENLNIFQMFISEDRNKVRENVWKVLSGEKLGSNEYTALKKDDSTFPVMLHLNPIIHGKKSVGIGGIVVDITKRKKAEEERLKAKELQGVKNMIVTYNHQMNSPLVGIVSYLNLLLRNTEKTHEDYQTLRELKKGVDKLLSILQKIQSLERVESTAYLGDARMIDLDK